MKILVLLSIGLVIGLKGCSFINIKDDVKGSGIVKTEKRSLDGFTSLDINCAGSIEVRFQAPVNLEIRGDDNIVPLITTEVKDGTLYIRSSKEYEPKEKVKIILSVPDLKRFAFAGAGDADLTNIKNKRVEIALTGAGGVTASGETEEAEITLSGAGSVDAKNLHAVNARVNSTGVGSVDIYATGKLDAKTSGVGEINYYGSPKTVNKQAGGLGEINER
jgi:hypothetical protein